MTNVFISRPTWVSQQFEQGLEGFIRVLAALGLQPRTIGTTDYPRKAPLDEVIALMELCAGAIILGYPQITVTAGSIKNTAISADVELPTEWNHIEAGLAYARGLPLLVIHHVGISRGIFDRGAMSGFLYRIDLTDPSWPLRQEVQGALVNWQQDVVARAKPTLQATVAAVSTVGHTASSVAQPQRSPKYCRNCGAVPGEPSACNTPYSAHSFVPWVQDVFCRNCGHTPGSSKPCNVPFSAHSFSPI